MDPTTIDIRKTVLTPRTEFPMRAKLAQREPERLKRWEAEDLYGQIQKRGEGRPTFILHDGPPYANGELHLGHALNKILKDIIVRYRTMKGFHSPYVPGWDCHGLPIEQQVLKKLGPKIHTMEPVAVRRLCHDFAAKYIDIQRAGFKRLGVTGDWEKPYLTFDPAFEAGILSVLRDLVAKGLVRRGKKSVHWDPVFRTALAEAEIEYHSHESDSIYVKFPLRESGKYPSLKGLENVSIVIWTTTPWTLPANRAICLHPEFDYVALTAGEEHYIVARELAGPFAKACGLEPTETAAKFRAAELEGAECDHPVFEHLASRIVLGEHVTLEAGTGCVHTAPGHGADDFEIGTKYGLEVAVPVDASGRFNDEYPEMEGISVFEANPKIIENMRRKGLLLAASKITHDYPYSWRSHKPIIFRATEQWFMEVGEGELRRRALDAIEHEVKWVPPWGRERIHAMVEQRPDWCLSRQRSWGVPIPSIRSRKSGASILDVHFIDAFIKVVAEKGTDAWFTEPLESFWPAGWSYEPTGESSPEDFEKEFDILDVWFDSGAGHVALLENDPRLSSPADLYLEGSDQHRGWFQSALWTSIGARDRPPYRAVLTHGFVLDGQGKAMSKSAGNVISPLDLMKTLGADILRLWVASEDYRTDVSASKEILDRISEAYRRIRNALRFLLGNLFDYEHEKHAVDFQMLQEADRWILSRLADLSARVDEAYDRYEFHRVYHLVYGFANTELSAVYLDVAKDRLYCSAPEDATRRAAQTAIHHLLDTLTRLIAPIVVFTAEEAWEYATPGGQSVHLADFPQSPEEWRDERLEAKWSRLLELRDRVSLALEESRRAKTIGHSLDAVLELAPADQAEHDFWTENLALFKMLFIVSDVRIGPSAPGEGSPLVQVSAASWPKCERCWMKTPEVGHEPRFPTLCGRCVAVVSRLGVG